MQTIESLKKTIKSAEDLQSVVKTMKALAAVSIRQYQRAVESLLDYTKTVEMGLQVALHSRPETVELAWIAPLRKIGVIIFGSDQGLCGQLNEQIAVYALEEMEKLGVDNDHRTVMTVGLRVNGFIEDAGLEVAESLTVPGSTAGITPMVQEVMMILEEWHIRQQIEHVYMFYNEYISGASYRQKTLHLLPVDRNWLKNLKEKKWPTKTLPTFTMDWNLLFGGLIREYLFVSLYGAFAESLASENASRLAAMQSAEKNIEERLQELQGQFHRKRQMNITEELLDIVAGFEALSEKKISRRGERKGV
ncbi:MAG: F0F1 ATP synthase subunit gamma [Deltaproteobacteria bacterium]|nr:F0F1 ATP synthase subunit gamma [Deltaproteobacteria bacterium]